MAQVVDPLNDEISSVELLPNEQSDLVVVNAARVSMHKFHREIEDKDTGLINYLAKHKHWTPFSHVQYVVKREMTVNDFATWVIKTQANQFERVMLKYPHDTSNYVMFLERGSLFAFLENGIVTDKMKECNPLSVEAFNMTNVATHPRITDMTFDEAIDSYGIGHSDIRRLLTAQFRIKMPIFVARQWYKHQMGFTRNEVSRRYVSDSPEFYLPATWRAKPEGSVKQGSAEYDANIDLDMLGWIDSYNMDVEDIYEAMISDYNVAPEMVRMLLPQSMYTEFIETASLAAYDRLIDLRKDGHAQVEIQNYALAIEECFNE